MRGSPRCPLNPKGLYYDLSFSCVKIYKKFHFDMLEFQKQQQNLAKCKMGSPLGLARNRALGGGKATKSGANASSRKGH